MEARKKLGITVYDDWRKVYSNEEFNQTLEYGSFSIDFNQFEGLKTFFTDRYNLIKQSLEDEGFTYSTTAVSNIGTNTPGLKFFPNPSNGLLNIEESYSINQIFIYDIHGREVMKIDQPAFPINISNLKSGTYLVSVLMEGGLTTSKVIISLSIKSVFSSEC